MTEPTSQSYQRVLTALCIYREARGESKDAKRAVYHVIRNRMRDSLDRRPSLASEVILQKFQFSSFLASDPNAAVFPHANDAAWLECCAVVDAPGDDPTGGANHYHSGPSPKWAEGRVQTAQIGAFRFYRL